MMLRIGEIGRGKYFLQGSAAAHSSGALPNKDWLLAGFALIVFSLHSERTDYSVRGVAQNEAYVFDHVSLVIESAGVTDVSPTASKGSSRNDFLEASQP
jgi:hypothetical protein